MTAPTTGLPGAFRPAPIAFTTIADYRGKCTRCGHWWHRGDTVAKTTVGQYVCDVCMHPPYICSPAGTVISTNDTAAAVHS